MTDDETPVEKKRWPFSWGRAEWVPLGLLVLWAGINYRFTPVGQAMPANYDPRSFSPQIAMIGAMVSQQIVCGLWGAWAFEPAIKRLPVFLSATTLLAFLALQGGNSGMEGILLFSCIGFLTWLILAVIRMNYHYRFSVNDLRKGRVGKNQFSISYLLFWTTMISLLAMLGRIIEVNFFSDEFAGTTRESIVYRILQMIAGYLILLLPAILALFLPFISSWSWLLKLTIFITTTSISLLIGTAVIGSYSSLQAIIQSDEIYQIPSFITGSILCLGSSSLTLRWAGYRITKTPVTTAIAE